MTQVAPTVDEGPAEHDDLLCAACGHRMLVHDRTAARYCVATKASGAVRGCLCPPNAVSDGAQPLSTTTPFR